MENRSNDKSTSKAASEKFKYVCPRCGRQHNYFANDGYCRSCTNSGLDNVHRVTGLRGKSSSKRGVDIEFTMGETWRLRTSRVRREIERCISSTRMLMKVADKKSREWSDSCGCSFETYRRRERDKQLAKLHPMFPNDVIVAARRCITQKYTGIEINKVAYRVAQSRYRDALNCENEQIETRGIASGAPSRLGVFA